MILRKVNILIIFLLFQFCGFAAASDLSIKIGKFERKITSYEIRGIEYVSSKAIAEAFSANFFYNESHQKFEIKFKDYKLKFTINNQFVILTSKKSNQHQVFQMPVSARKENSEIVIPIKYALKYLGLGSGMDLVYNENQNLITVKSENIDTKNLVNWNENLIDVTNVKYDIYSAKVENKANGTLLRLGTKRPIREPASSVKDNKLYLFFSNITVDNSLASTFKSTGLINDLQIKYVNGNPQIELELKDGFDNYEVFYDEEINEVLVSLHNKYLKTENINLNSDEIKKWQFDVVVIDPGHGGKDPGAIGINGLKEKDVNLAIAKELGNLIKKNMPEVKVVYTRSNDQFVELYKRGKIANENKGNLFISIHCNSTPKKPTNASGIEVYLLRPGRTKEAIDIAEFENSVISLEEDQNRYQKLTDENFILVSMAHASNMRYSESFADMLDTEWKNQIKIPARGIKQAGFYVLVGASMPSVLIETGFISNKNDAKYLGSKSGQKEIASSIFDAVFKYKKYYENSIINEIKK
ncbi:MAG: N-acetylmuramoyl-L-alanine amidase [Ignavibacteriae bacterium]|nr:N-acetylmuramoyl-L-alanine amidase [Ignavibacteriota bacterium]